jgi:hypothetical protein
LLVALYKRDDTEVSIDSHLPVAVVYLKARSKFRARKLKEGAALPAN